MCRTLSFVLSPVLILFFAMLGSANQLPSANEPSTSAVSHLKKKVLEIPAGSPVVVKLRTKETIRGRLEDVSNDGVTVKVAEGPTIEDRKLPFDQVKSVRKAGGPSAKKIAGYSALAVGATVVVVTIAMVALIVVVTSAGGL